MTTRYRQQGWVGLLVLLLALVVVGLLARTALKQYGVASGLDAGERTVKKLPPGASEVDQAAAVTPRNALDRARGVQDMVKQGAADQEQRIDDAIPK